MHQMFLEKSTTCRNAACVLGNRKQKMCEMFASVEPFSYFCSVK